MVTPRKQKINELSTTHLEIKSLQHDIESREQLPGKSQAETGINYSELNENRITSPAFQQTNFAII